ncbi:uncharacterized protein LOC121726456 [Aricia agestis]|uniref:uncharacterized protein LOC121726456 n=1 Tax=Aricia agestis TaxID=91739 RepID=UPI001C202D64|nr:uncharacterized protein LOC121726456 [Aricia agestis]
MKTGLLYGIVASSKTRVRCIFCGVFIPKASKCIEEHASGTKHKENIQQMSENGITCNDKELYCQPCDYYFTEDDSVVSHLDGDDHENWMVALYDLIDGEFINVDAFLACESKEAHCDVCKLNIHCSLLNVEEHVNAMSHRINVCEELKPSNAIFRVEDDTELWCKLCDAYIDNTITSVMKHVDDDEEHVGWFAEIEELIEGHDISIENFLKNEHEKYAFCNKCQMEVICDTQNIQSHVDSESHLNQFS